MKYFLLFALMGTLVACSNDNGVNDTASNKSSTSPDAGSATTEQKPAEATNECYMKITGRDTAILVVEQKGNDLSGQMLYDNFQKDGSHGTVKGKKDGDILKLYYDFNAEGTRSIMEVYFKQAPGGLLRGIGDMDVKGDTAYFTSGINYPDKEAFSKVDCNLVKSRFQ